MTFDGGSERIVSNRARHERCETVHATESESGDQSLGDRETRSVFPRERDHIFFDQHKGFALERRVLDVEYVTKSVVRIARRHAELAFCR